MVKSLLQNGHKVKYISQYSNPRAENYSATKPTVIGYSSLFKFFETRFFEENLGNQKKFGLPPLNDLWTKMKTFDPDVVIVRDYGLVSAVVLLMGNFLNAGGIMQELIPKYREPSEKKYLFKRLYNTVFRKPLLTVTPIQGNEDTKTAPKHVYYVPYPVDLDLYEPFGEKEYFLNDKINIINVGTLSAERKNQINLLRAFDSLSGKYNLHLTLVGHLSNKQNNHYQQIRSYIQENGLESDVDITTNMEYQKLQKEYKKHDLFVFPSRREPLGMAGLEAMAAGLPVICGQNAGVSSYVENKYNGYHINANSVEDLTRKMKLAVECRDNLIQMSKNAIQQIQENHTPDEYCNQMINIVNKNFD
jgi:glycosyltransferase involved in cell wall biosynthesis